MTSSAHLSLASVLGSWTAQPLVLLPAAAAAAWYLRAVRGSSVGWSKARTASFLTGLVLLILLCCGPATRYARSIYWVWVAQVLALLLVVPVPLMAGQPLQLCRLAGNRLGRWAGTDRLRWLFSPLLGPGLVPLICVAALFGPLPGAAAGSAAVAWPVQLVLVLLGSVIVLPLVAADGAESSVALGIALAVGLLELLIDAIPGIVLRLSTHPVSSFFTHRLPLAQAPTWLHDQQLGGGVLWCVAELLDLPFLILIFRRWLRADAREAALIDASLDQHAPDQPGAQAQHPTVPEAEQPWFLTDPQLRDRFR